MGWVVGAAWTCACASLVFAGARMARQGPKPSLAFASACVAGIAFVFALRLRPEFALAILPLDFFAPLEEAAAVPFALGGLAAALRPGLGRGRRAAFLILLVLVFAVGAWMAGRRLWPRDFPDLTTRIENGVCLQSREETCVAAALVTLLRELGRPAEEADMARLSFTVPGVGSSALRACRALQVVFAGTGRSVTVVRPGPYGPFPTPCLMPISYGPMSEHMTVLLGLDGDGFLVGDPLAGRMRWTRDRFERRWCGYLIAVR